jgi:hypothetical protein
VARVAVDEEGERLLAVVQVALERRYERRVATPAVTVEWVVPAPPEGADCPARAALEAKVAASLRPDARDVTARVVVRTTTTGVHVAIAWRGSNRDFDAPSCSEAADAAALILSLDDQELAPLVPAVPPRVAPVAAAVPSAPPAPPPAPVAAAPALTYLSARGFVDTGTLAEPALGASLGAAHAFGRVDLGITASFAAGLGGAADASGQGARFDSVTGGLEAFLPFRLSVAGEGLELGPVAGAEGGALFARGTGVDHPASKTSGVAAALAAGRGRFALSSGVALVVDLGLTVPFDRPSFYFSPSATDFARVAPVSFRGAVGLSVRFP